MVQTWDQDTKTSRTARLTPYIPRFDVALANVTGLAEEDFPTDPALAMAYWSLRYAQTDARRTLSAIARIAGNLKDLEALHSPIEDVSLYFTSVTDLTLGEMMETIEKVLEDVRLKESFMGARDTLLLRSMRESKQKGIQLGVQVGNNQTKLHFVRALAAKGKNPQDIAELLDLSEDEVLGLLKPFPEE